MTAKTESNYQKLIKFALIRAKFFQSINFNLIYLHAYTLGARGSNIFKPISAIKQARTGMIEI